MQAYIDFPNDAAATDPLGNLLADPLTVGGRWQGFFSHPVAVLTAWQLHEVPGVLQQVQAFSAAGHWCVGGLAYEAAGAFDAALVTHPPSPRLAAGTVCGVRPRAALVAARLSTKPKGNSNLSPCRACVGGANCQRLCGLCRPRNPGYSSDGGW